MAWTVRYTADVDKSLRKLDRLTERRLRDALRNVEALDDPRSRGQGLTGPLAGLWRYRVGDYRIICHIRDAEFLVLVLEVGRRDNVYN